MGVLGTAQKKAPRSIRGASMGDVCGSSRGAGRVISPLEEKGLDKGQYGDSEGDPRPDIIKGSDHMKTFEDYKRAIENAGPALVEKLLAQADADGLTAWQLAELAGLRAELWV